MILSEATQLATRLIVLMQPYCELIRTAGSVRRGCDTCRDIELVAVPHRIKVPVGLFGDTAELNLLHQWATLQSDIQWIKPATAPPVPPATWEPATIRPDGRYWRGLLPDGTKIDLFLTTPQNFGAVFLIRTGSSKFSQAVVTHGRDTGRPFRDGRLWIDGAAADTPREEDMFRLLGLRYIPPSERLDRNSLVRIGGGA